MSTTSETPEVTESDAATADAVEATGAVDLSALTDARVEDEAGFTLTLAVLVAAAKSAVAAFKRNENASHKLAEARTMIRAYFVRADGIPDWSADTDAYSVAVQNVEAQVMVNLSSQQKNRLNATVRQMVRRKYLLPAIVGWCLSHYNGLAKESELWYGITDTAEDGTVTTNLRKEEDGTLVPRTESEIETYRSKVLGDPSEKLKGHVRAHYRARNLTIPDGPFQDVVQPTDPGDVADTPDAVTAALTTAVAGASQMIPRYAVLETLHLLSIASKKLVADHLKEIDGRPEIIAMLDRIDGIAMLTARLIDPTEAIPAETFEAESAKLATLYFDPEADKA